MVQLKGIDLSSHNGSPDFDKIKADDIDFVMLRLGFGSDLTSQDDKQFERNVREAERVGIPWGGYLYSYSLTPTQAKSEAQHVLRLLKGKHPTYPIAFDMEDADGFKKKHGVPSNSTLVEICDTFLSTIENDGYYAMLYASLSWFNNQLNDKKLDRYDKWVAQWTSKCTYNKTYHLWQYSSDGSVNGVNGRVDMNYAYLDFPSITDPKKVSSQPQTKEDNSVPNLFKDVPSNYWAYEAIKNIKDKGIMNGHQDGTFAPDAPLTRAQLAATIDNLLKYLGK